MLGLYPTWADPAVGSGLMVAFIATIHVLFSHASVGAAILFGYLANLGVRKNKPEYIQFIKKYGLFLLIFSYVLGSITGPGIWFSATIASPRGISSLIHTFVWVWATEWVFFIIEVIGIYLLVYLAGKVDVRTHTKLSLIFCLSSVATLLIIVGVLSFMLWPGSPNWLAEGGVSQAFFGPNTLAQACTRLAFVLTITAVVGGIVASRISNPEDKKSITRQLSALGVIGAVLGYGFFSWYMTTLPEYTEILISTRLPETYGTMMIAAVGITVLYFALTAWKPAILQTWLACVMTVVILVFGLSPEELARESIRKPWIAGQYMYSNQVIGRDVPALNIKSELPVIEEKGVLATHPFVPEQLRKITPENELEAGRVIATAMCSNCHSLTDKGIRPLVNYIPKNPSLGQLEDYLAAGLYRGHTAYMPAIPLPPEERKALAVYLKSLADKYSKDKGAQ